MNMARSCRKIPALYTFSVVRTHDSPCGRDPFSSRERSENASPTSRISAHRLPAFTWIPARRNGSYVEFSWLVKSEFVRTSWITGTMVPASP